MRKKLFVCLCLILVVFTLNCGMAFAADEISEETKLITFDEINETNVFFKQSRRGTCTLASAAMMIRRAELIYGSEDWEDATESSVGSVAWTGAGLSWQFTYEDITVTHAYVSSEDELKELLEKHPEGIVAYDSNKPHAILLTDYDKETDTFYCSDPAEGTGEGRIPASEASIELENADVVWYVSTPEDLQVDMTVTERAAEVSAGDSDAAEVDKIAEADGAVSSAADTSSTDASSADTNTTTAVTANTDEDTSETAEAVKSTEKSSAETARDTADGKTVSAGSAAISEGQVLTGVDSALSQGMCRQFEKIKQSISIGTLKKSIK